VAVVQVRNPYWRGIRLWLPVFLLWLPLLALSPLILLVVLGLCLAGRIAPWRAVRVLWGVLWALPGTEIQVHAGENHVLVGIR
jgi:hypothetical protein